MSSFPSVTKNLQNIQIFQIFQNNFWTLSSTFLKKFTFSNSIFGIATPVLILKLKKWGFNKQITMWTQKNHCDTSLIFLSPCALLILYKIQFFNFSIFQFFMFSFLKTFFLFHQIIGRECNLWYPVPPNFCSLCQIKLNLTTQPFHVTIKIN